MKLVLNSITYHDCPVQIREKLALSAEERHSILRRLHTEPAISEAAVLQTCNRLEFYFYCKKDFDCAALLTELIRQVRPDAVDAWAEHRTESTALDVVRHLFEVTAGLDSQMLGENQILSQVKSAYTESLNCRMSKLVFHRLFHNAFRVGKAVRTNTDINCGAVSVALAAVELAKKNSTMSACTAILIGAGENAELVGRYLSKAGLKHLIIANRDRARAQNLTSQLGAAEPISLDDIPGRLAEADLIISTTAAAEPLLKYEQLRSILTDREKPLLIIDIAVPRDIEPDIGQLRCVSLYNIDDLNEQIAGNRDKRSREIPKARAIVNEFTDQFATWHASLDLTPVISHFWMMSMPMAEHFRA